ncbi:hypothetical protein ZWY2020_029116, partial [Hordeum vulgare]
MQRCHGKDKVAASAMPHHAKGKATASAMPHHAKDKAATCCSACRQHRERLAPPSELTEGFEYSPSPSPSPSPVMGLRREMSQKRGDKVDTTSIPHKHNAKDTPDLLRRQALDMSLEQREKVGTGLIPQAHNAKDKTCPPDQLRRQTQRPVKTEARLAGEKKHKTEAHLADRESTPKGMHLCQRKNHYTTQRKNDFPYSDECDRPMDDHGNPVVIQEQRQESAAIETGKDVEYITEKMNKLGVRDDIGLQEYYECLMKLPPNPSIDTSKAWYTTSRYDMDIRHAVYRIKSYKVSSIHIFQSSNAVQSGLLPSHSILSRETFPRERIRSRNKHFAFRSEIGDVPNYFGYPMKMHLSCVAMALNTSSHYDVRWHELRNNFHIVLKHNDILCMPRHPLNCIHQNVSLPTIHHEALRLGGGDFEEPSISHRKINSHLIQRLPYSRQSEHISMIEAFSFTLWTKNLMDITMIGLDAAWKILFPMRRDLSLKFQEIVFSPVHRCSILHFEYI